MLLCKHNVIKAVGMVRTMSWMTRFLSCMSVASVIAGGGGGGGDSAGNGGSSTATPPNPTASLSISTPTLDVSASLAQPAPTAGFTVGIVRASTSTKFYIKGSYTSHGIASIAAMAATASYTIQFESPTSLGIGTYQDTVTIEGCYDTPCTQQVSNSPQTVSVTYTVTAGPGTLTSLSPSMVQAGVAFTLTVNGSGFDAGSVVI